MAEDIKELVKENENLSQQVDKLTKLVNKKEKEKKDSQMIGKGYLPAKTAALEVYRKTTQSRTMAIVSIVGVFIVAITGRFSEWAGASAAGIISMGYAYFIWKDTMFTKYLENKYNIKKKPILEDDSQ